MQISNFFNREEWKRLPWYKQIFINFFLSWVSKAKRSIRNGEKPEYSIEDFNTGEDKLDKKIRKKYKDEYKDKMKNLFINHNSNLFDDEFIAKQKEEKNRIIKEWTEEEKKRLIQTFEDNVKRFLASI